MAQHRDTLQPPAQKQLFHQQKYGEIQAPQYEGPGGPVPQARQAPYHQQVQHPASQPHPAAAQGDIHIVPEPGAQGDVPAPPELRETAGHKGIAEVLGKAEAHDPAQADGHVAVAGEVEVHMEHIRRGVQPGQQHRFLPALLIHRHQLIQDVGKQYLFPQAQHKAAGAQSRVLHRVGAASQLGGHVGVADDGARHQLGVHSDIRRQVNEVPLGRGVPPVHVDDIAEDLEGIEADADGQGHPQQRHRQAGDGVEAGDQEVGILAVGQYPQAQHGGQGQQQPPAGGIPLHEPGGGIAL